LGNSEWFNAFEERAKLPVTNRLPKQQRCRLVQGQLERHTYIINEQLGWTISLERATGSKRQEKSPG
jgi:hypothetical protein